MSRIVQIENATIQKPEVLERAIQEMARLSNLQAVPVFHRNREGKICGGSISIPSNVSYEEMQRRKAAMHFDEVRRIEGKFPGYFAAGTTYSKALVSLRKTPDGSFQLTCDEDYSENFRLASVLMDHYLAEIVRETLIEQGHSVEIHRGTEGLTVDATCWDENDQTVVSEY